MWSMQPLTMQPTAHVLLVKMEIPDQRKHAKQTKVAAWNDPCYQMTRRAYKYPIAMELAHRVLLTAETHHEKCVM